jgi:hypothetical protein
MGAKDLIKSKTQEKKNEKKLDRFNQNVKYLERLGLLIED